MGFPDPGQSRAFISYSHQDEAFVLALVQRLEEHGIGVWIDQVDLLIGDSLIHRIGDAIHEGDFVIAVISQHSVNSSWCEKELTLAVTHGIQSKQVKVLPVRLDGVALPNFLADTLWVEADRSDCTAVAAELASAVERHLERRRHGAGAIKTDSSAAGEEPVDSQGDHSESGSAQETDFPIEHDIPIDRFDVVQAPIPPIGWAENNVFRVGYPPDWYDTTPTEPTIEGKPALVVLRRDDHTGLPSDFESRGVIRCFLHGRGTSGEFFAAAPKLDHLRARALRGRLIEPLQFVRAGGAPCYTFRVDGTIRIRAFQASPSAITEVHLFHNGEWFLMQLESDPKFHADYQQALATVLGTLTWK
ncbi:MAG: toll/interleukin-1 receptor domain-containing protein [Solirubrobacterales bacterium]